jgi:PAS domain S-box-containing protein
MKTSLYHGSIAVALVLLAWGAQEMVGHHFGVPFAFLPFLVASMLAALLGGLNTGLLATGLGYVVAAFFYVNPGTLLVHGLDNLVTLGVYALFSLSTAMLAGSLQQSRRAAHALAERLRVTFRSMGDAVIVTDPEGRITALNPVAESLAGCAQDTARGKLLREVFPIRLATGDFALVDPISQVLKCGHAVGPDQPTVLMCRDGRTISVENNAAPMRDAEGKIVGIVLIFRDVTQQRKSEAALKESERVAQDRLALLDHVYHTAPVGLGLVDRDLCYVRINHQLAAMDGRAPEDCLGRSLRELVPDLADHLEPLYRRVLDTGEPILAQEVHGRTPADPDQAHDWLVSYHPVHDAEGEVIAVSSVVLDITQRKRTEETLRDADRRKNEFLAMLAHELRNPLATIQYATMLSRFPSTDGDDTEWSEIIERQVQHLARLVDDLLDVSRISRGKIQLKREPVDAVELIRNAVKSMQSALDERQHRLDLQLPEIPLPLHADPTRIEQVILNLVNNACKYTPPGGDISVVAQAEGDDAVIRVTDTGIGIPKDLLGHVFDLFTQGEQSLDRAQGGLGIGLTLVRHITEMHGGSISAVSGGQGRGSTFTVRLPLCEQQARPLQNQQLTSSVGNDSRKRVLVVEDNVEAANALQQLLEAAGHEVAVCYTGTAALATACSFLPDVIFLDIGLPGKDGYEVVQEIRSEKQLCHAVVIALSGYGQKSVRERALACGFDDHFVKPVDLNRLRAAVVGRS